MRFVGYCRDYILFQQTRFSRSKIHKNVICETCKKTFASTVTLKVHIKSVHEGISREICDICKMTFKSSRNLRRHMERLHFKLQSKNSVCEICKKSFLRNCSLKEHIKFVHYDVRNHKCPKCDKSFFAICIFSLFNACI